MITTPMQFARRKAGGIYASAMGQLAAVRFGARPVAAELSAGVTVVGHLGRRTGISRGALLQSEALRLLGVNTDLVDATASIRNPFARSPSELQPGPVVVHTGGPQLGFTVNYLAPQVRKNYRVGYAAWELPEPPWHWRGFDRSVHEIWTPSVFSAEALRAVAQRPVYAVPHVSAAPQDIERGSFRAKLGLPEDTFLVLTLADLRSSLARKNPQGAIRAFRCAFGERKDVCLVVKLTSADRSPALVKALAQEAGSSNVRFFSEYLSSRELWSLFIDTDVFVSLHRAEGFGIPIMEAMSAGCAVLATNWSGNVDFMNERIAAPIPYQLQPVYDPQGIYRRGVWAEPDLDTAIDWLRRLEADRRVCRSLGNAARSENTLKQQLERFRQRLPDSIRMPAILETPVVITSSEATMPDKQAREAIEPVQVYSSIHAAPSVSIVVVNHNYAAFVAKAVESALAQTGPVDRVVVVDDGSTDDSQQVIERYADRVTVVSKPAGGHVSAVNAGYEATGGDLCIFLDADDFLYPNCAAEVAKAWRPSDSKLQYRLDTVDKNGIDQGMSFPYFPKSLTSAEIRKQSVRTGTYPWTVSSGCVFARHFLEKMMPIDASRIYRSPDGYLSKMAPLYGDVRSLPLKLGAYRVHGANAWAQSSGSPSVEGIVRWLKFDQVLEAAYLEAAMRLGIKIRKPLLPTFQQLEHRMLAHRFAPEQSPFAEDTALRLFLDSLLMTAHTKNARFLERATKLAWLSAIDLAPKSLVLSIAGKTRGQSNRSTFAKTLLSWARRQEV